MYLSGPITAAHGFSVAENVASAVGVYLECCRRGVPAFCPHLSAEHPEGMRIPYARWMALDLAVLRRCTHLLKLPRWEGSPGARAEVTQARAWKIPVIESLDEVA